MPPPAMCSGSGSAPRAAGRLRAAGGRLDLVRGAGLPDAALRGGGAARSARVLSQAQPALCEKGNCSVLGGRVLQTTKDRNWNGKPLVCDDPLMLRSKADAKIRLFNPAMPIHGQEPFLILAESWTSSARRTNRALPRDGAHRPVHLPGARRRPGSSRAWTLVDLKVEFGFDHKGNLLLADVIDNEIPGGAEKRRLHRQAGLPRWRRA